MEYSMNPRHFMIRTRIEEFYRRILWGWIEESDSEYAYVAKGWASVQVHLYMI